LQIFRGEPLYRPVAFIPFREQKSVEKEENVRNEKPTSGFSRALRRRGGYSTIIAKRNRVQA